MQVFVAEVVEVGELFFALKSVKESGGFAAYCCFQVDVFGFYKMMDLLAVQGIVTGQRYYLQNLNDSEIAGRNLCVLGSFDG